MHCWPRLTSDSDQSMIDSGYMYTGYQYDSYQSYGSTDWLSRCEIWNETDTQRVSAPHIEYLIQSVFNSGDSHNFYGVLALYNGKATAIINQLRMIQSLTPKRRWKRISSFRGSFWNSEYDSYELRIYDLSAVTLDSGNLLIMGGGKKNDEINKLKNDVVSHIGNLQYV